MNLTLITLAEKSYVPPRNIVDELNFLINVLEAAPKVADKDSDNFIDERQESLAKKKHLLSFVTEELSEEERLDFDKSFRLVCEEGTRIYLQVAIEEANSTFTYVCCAELADKLLVQRLLSIRLTVHYVFHWNGQLQILIYQNWKKKNYA